MIEDSKMKHIPNIITSVRIVGTLVLIGTELSSIGFFVIYSICGFSDVLDGCIARKFKLTSELGAKLDSIADMMFYFVMLLKMIPFLLEVMPCGFWVAVNSVVVVRVISYIVAALKYKRFASLHTYLNKLTGLSIFVMPYITQFTWFVYYVIGACVVAVVATLEELFLHIIRKEYRANV